MMNIKASLLRLGVGFLATLLPLSASAATYETNKNADISYHYSVYGEAVPAPDFYTYHRTLGEGLKKPSDLFFYNGNLFVIDSGNNRVAVFDPITGELLHDIIPKTDSGENFSIKDAHGVFITDNGQLYVCLYEQKKIAVLSEDGTVEKLFDAPTDALIEDDFTYFPHQVAVQQDGRLYVVSEGTYQGLIQLSEDGEFIRFFGSNQVKADVSTILNMMWRKLFNQEQEERLANNLPVDYSAVTLGPDGFLYSTTANATTQELKKHGPDGSNVLRSNQNTAPGVLLGGNDYGDLETYRDGETTVDTRFVDLAVTDDGLIFALDESRSRLFCYDQQSNLLGIFGTKANQASAFTMPVAVEVYKDAVYVLDQERGQVFVFEPTAYAQALMTAAGLYNEGLFSDAAPYWEIVRKHNSNLSLCSAGLGWAALEAEDYATAMSYFREACDRVGYNQAFLAQRNQFMKDWGGVIFACVVMLIICVFILLSLSSKKGAFEVDNGVRKTLTPFHVMFHPSVGFDAMKDKQMGSNRWAVGMVLALFVVRLLSIRYTGFLFNPYRPETINMLVEFVQIVAIFAGWVVCSWAVGTLVNSEARIGEIFRASAYALCPYMVLQLLSVLISNVLLTRESAFVTGLSMVGLYWAALWMLISVVKTHKFTVGKALLFIVLTLVGIFFLLFLAVMFYSLAGQFGTFITTIYDEIQFRL